LANNPRIQEAGARLAAAAEEATVAFAPFLPNLDSRLNAAAFNVPILPGGAFVPASLNAGVFSYTLAEAGIQWTLYDFGRTAGKYLQARARERIAQRTLARLRQSVAHEVVQAYLRLLLAEATLQTQQQALRQAEAILRDTRSLREGGAALRDAILRAEVEVSKATEQVVGAERQILDGRAGLNLALGRPAPVPIEVEKVSGLPEGPPSLRDSLERAIAVRPEVEIAHQVVQEAVHGEQAARGELLPRLYVRGTVVHADSDPGVVDGWVTGGGIHLDQPLYSGGRRLAEVRRQQALYAAATAGLRSILDRVSYQVTLAFQALAPSRERIRLGATAVTQARETLRLTLARYREGLATPTDVVDAETARTQAEIRYLTARYEYLGGLSDLEYAEGGDQGRFLAGVRHP
jgi:outer membrane protein TolC